MQHPPPVNTHAEGPKNSDSGQKVADIGCEYLNKCLDAQMGDIFKLAFVSSTGRTATTFIGRVLDELDGVLACHEGKVDSLKFPTSSLPMINLENRQVYYNPEKGKEVIAAKRSPEILEGILRETGNTYFCDVAYYNAVLGQDLLETHSNSNFVSIIRNCEEFVKSATCLEGEDPMPAGWASNSKPLTDREKFIAMGRLKPHKEDEAAEKWSAWSATMKNIWLWRETNQIILDVAEAFPDRTTIVRFETLKTDPITFWRQLLDGIGLKHISTETMIEIGKNATKETINRKAGGHQLPSASHWLADEQDFLKVAQTEIEQRWEALNER